MHRPPCLTFLACLALPTVLAAQRLHVDAGAPPGGDGTTWATALRDLGQALALAHDGTEVWVATGTYAGGFRVPAGVTLAGGFQPGASRRDQAQPMLWPTVLDGQNAQRVLDLADRAVVDGCVVQNGNAPAPGGGGALVDGTAPVLVHCLFRANAVGAGRGAGLYVLHGGTPQVRDCAFVGHGASGHTIDVDLGGGGVYDHLTVADNQHNGMHMQNGADCVIANSIFARNQGRGICDVASGAPNTVSLHHVLFFANRVSLMHYRGTELQTIAAVNGLAYASANVDGDPAFVAAGDYRLGPTSAAIDRGAGAPGTLADAFLDPRLLDGDGDGTAVPDIGWHEHDRVTLAVAGVPMSGSTLQATIAGPAGSGGALAVALAGHAHELPPFGTFFGDAPQFVWLPGLPAATTVRIPATVTGDFVLQAAALLPVGSSLSNAVPVAIR